MIPYDAAEMKHYDKCAQLLRPDEQQQQQQPAETDDSKAAEQGRDESGQIENTRFKAMTTVGKSEMRHVTTTTPI